MNLMFTEASFAYEHVGVCVRYGTAVAGRVLTPSLPPEMALGRGRALADASVARARV